MAIPIPDADNIYMKNYFVGQGQMSLIKATANGHTNFLALCDAGGDKNFRYNIDSNFMTRPHTNIDTSVNKNLKEIVTEIEGFGNRLNLLMISHQDKDHWNLLEMLSGLFDAYIYIDIAVIGGAYWRSNSWNSVKKVLQDLTSIPSEQFTYPLSYTIAHNTTELLFSANTHRLFVSNCYNKANHPNFMQNPVATDPHQNCAKGLNEKRNSTGAILELEVGAEGSNLTVTNIFTGDLNLENFKQLNLKLQYKIKCYFFTVPHHGSCPASEKGYFEGYSNFIQHFDTSNIPWPNVFSASVSGIKDKYKHPNLGILRLTEQMCRLGNPFRGGTHYYLGYDLNTDLFNYFPTDRQLFSTVTIPYNNPATIPYNNPAYVCTTNIIANITDIFVGAIPTFNYLIQEYLSPITPVIFNYAPKNTVLAKKKSISHDH